MKKSTKRRITAGLFACMILGVTGCSNGADKDAAKEAGQSAEIPVEASQQTDPKDSSQDGRQDGAQTGLQDGFPFTLTTKDDMEVTFNHVPERVLSTNPNTGEQLMALGLGDKIIATCSNNAPLPAQYREEYEKKPVIGEKYPSLEAVLDLNPDFIYGRSSAFSEKDTAIGSHDTLSKYGIMSLSSIEGYKLGCDVEDVYQDFYNLGRIFKVEDKADEVVAHMKTQIAAVEERIRGYEPVKVFNFDAEREGGAYTPGNNFTSKLIRHAGGVNIFENLEKTWNTVSWEAVLEANPDVIIINDYGSVSADDKIALLNATPALSGVKAIKDQNFIIVTLPELFASARVGDTVEKLAAGFHPQAFQ